MEYARDLRVGAAEASAVEIHKGEGISGLVCGRRVSIGNRQLMSEAGCDVDGDADRRAQQWQKAGRTVAFFAWDGAVRGLLGFGDEIKPGAAEMVQRLRDRGIRVKLVSGDAWPTTAVVAEQIGVDDFTAEAAPATKARIVEELQRAGKRVALIGDGVNDAPALAQADLGIALGTGADIAMGAAPVVLVSGSLSKIEDAFCLAAKTAHVVRQNLFWAFVYNIVGITWRSPGCLRRSSPRPPCYCRVHRSWRIQFASRGRWKGRDCGEIRLIDATDACCRLCRARHDSSGHAARE